MDCTAYASPSLSCLHPVFPLVRQLLPPALSMGKVEYVVEAISLIAEYGVTPEIFSQMEGLWHWTEYLGTVLQPQPHEGRHCRIPSSPQNPWGTTAYQFHCFPFHCFTLEGVMSGNPLICPLLPSFLTLCFFVSYYSCQVLPTVGT
jgi:hypothetical protein